jgi:chemotaxis protein CheX
MQLPPAIYESLEDAFAQMVMLPVSVGKSTEKESGAPTGNVSGTISLSGTHTDSGIEVRSQISLIFPEELAKEIFRSMMMMESDAEVAAEELNDVVGELANMTAGGAKTRLSEKGFQLALSLPTIAVGMNHHLCTPSGVKLSMVAPVSLNSDVFYTQISVS